MWDMERCSGGRVCVEEEEEVVLVVAPTQAIMSTRYVDALVSSLLRDVFL